MKLTDVLRRVWDHIAIAQHISISPEARRQSKQLAALLLIMTGIGIWLTASYVRESAAYLDRIALDLVLTIVTLAVLFVLFLINRWGHCRIAASTTILIIVASIFISAVPNASSNEVLMLYYLSVPIVLSGLLLTVRFTVLVAALCVAGVWLFPVVTSVSQSEVPLSTTMLVAAFVVVAAHQRQRLEAQRRNALKVSEERYHHLATHDSLTNLPNRLLFDDRLAQAVERQKRDGSTLGVFFIDLDNFKALNDALTHSGGDEVLRMVARRLTTCLRSYDTVARRGGDEYSVLVESLRSPDDCHVILRKIQNSLGEPLFVFGKEVYLTGSIGASTCPGDGVEGEELLRKADTALFAAKNAGRNTYAFYSDQMSRAAEDRLELAADLRHALERDEMQTLFQPQVHSGTEEIVGFECLLRWHHSNRGLISPGVFIPIAEESGLITELTQFVLATALYSLSKHRALGSGPRLSINISSRDIRDDRFPNMVEKYLRTYRVPPERLELELTENIIFREMDSARSRLESLKRLGVRIAVDDFGSGFSTLKQIAEFPIDTLKIDRSFILGLDTNPQHQAVIAGIMEMAARLGIDIVAEGVETEEQIDLLDDLGVRLIQGWYYSKAVPQAEAAGLMARSRPFAKASD